MKQGFGALCLPGDLKRRKPQGPQTAIQQSLIDINVVYQQLPKDFPKIGQITPQVISAKPLLSGSPRGVMYDLRRSQ